MSLPNLPDLNFFNNDAQTIIDEMFDLYKELVDKDLKKSSAQYLFFCTYASVILLQRQQYERNLKQNFLYFAEKEKLDHLGAMRDTPRLDAQGASVTLEFRLSAARNEDVVVPMGTRATNDSKVFFATIEPLIIKKGTLIGQVTATSITTGAETNAYEIGDINTIVDRNIPFVSTVRNTNKPQGGRDTETDAEYRERIYKAPAKFSIAGPKDAYEALSKQASSSIGEVTVNSPSPGIVHIYPLLNNGDIPNQATLDLIENQLSASTVRPLCDSVSVLAPVQVQYNLNITYWIDTRDTPQLDQLRINIESEINAWVLWQRMKIGRDINPSNLISRLIRTGAKRVEVASPIATRIEINQLATLNNKTVLFGGLEDE